MDARALAWIWFLLPSILHFVKPTLSTLLKQEHEYEQNESTENFKPARHTERLELLISTNPMERAFIYEPEIVTGKIRSYRQVELEAATSIEPTAVTESYTNMNVDSYDPLATTETVNSTYNNGTVIPLTSTDTYNSHDSSELTERYKSETRIPIYSTEKYDILEPPEVTKTDIANEVTDPSSGSKMYDTGPNSSEKNDFIERDQELSVVGLSETKSSQISDISKAETERIMVLQPSNEEKYAWLKETVHNMLENTMLKRETEDYVIQMNRKYVDLPIVEADNSIWRKYSRAIVETFVLEFCRNYPHYTDSQRSTAQWYKEEEYNLIYNTTLQHLRQKKGQTAMEFAAPVRRVADIYKAILDTPIGIVQSKCKAAMPHWLCFAEYVVRLADISDSCEYVWYHAQVHLTILQSIRHAKGAVDPADEVIAELDSRLSALDSNNVVNYLFDLIIETLGDLPERLKEPLLSQASLYNLIRELQSEDKLRCLSIDE